MTKKSKVIILSICGFSVLVLAWIGTLGLNFGVFKHIYTSCKSTENTDPEIMIRVRATNFSHFGIPWVIEKIESKSPFTLRLVVFDKEEMAGKQITITSLVVYFDGHERVIANNLSATLKKDNRVVGNGSKYKLIPCSLVRFIFPNTIPDMRRFKLKLKGYFGDKTNYFEREYDGETETSEYFYFGWEKFR